MLHCIKQKYLAIMIVSIILAVLGPLTNTAAAASAIVTGKVVNIRSGPGITYVKKGALLQGATVTVLENRGQWLKISLKSGLTGWVNAPYLKIKASSSSTVSKSTLSVKTSKIEVNTKIANLRTGPGTKHKIVAKVRQGDKLDLLGNSNGWYKVRTSRGIVAYILQGLTRIWTTQAAYAAETAPGGSQTATSGEASTVSDQGAAVGAVITSREDPAANGESARVIVSQDNSTGKTEESNPPPDNNAKNNFKIVLDAGHGGKDPGATGSAGTVEKDINLSLVTKTGVLLEQAGYQAIYTRTDDTFVGLYDRVDIANHNQADLFISIHCNATEKASKKGTSVYYYVDAAQPAVVAQASQRKLMAETIQRNLIADNPQLLDDSVRQQGFVVIRYTSMPSILIETAYLSNPGEESLLNDPTVQSNIASSIVEGVSQYLSNPMSTIKLTSNTESNYDFNSQFDVVNQHQ